MEVKLENNIIYFKHPETGELITLSKDKANDLADKIDQIIRKDEALHSRNWSYNGIF